MSKLTENNLYNIRHPFQYNVPGSWYGVAEPTVGKWYQGFDATHDARQVARYEGNGAWWPEGVDMYEFDYLMLISTPAIPFTQAQQPEQLQDALQKAITALESDCNWNVRQEAANALRAFLKEPQ